MVAKNEKQGFVGGTMGRELNITSDFAVFGLHQTIAHNNGSDSEEERFLSIWKSRRSGLVRFQMSKPAVLIAVFWSQARRKKVAARITATCNLLNSVGFI